MIALASPLTLTKDAAPSVASGFVLPINDKALSVLVSAPSLDAPSSVMAALLVLDPISRQLNGHTVSHALKRFQPGDLSFAEPSAGMHCPSGIAWPLPGLQINHDGHFPLSELLCFKTHIGMKSMHVLDSSSFVTLGCIIVQSLFVSWNDLAQAGPKQSSSSALHLQSSSFFVVPERFSDLSLLQSIMAALDNTEVASEVAQRTTVRASLKLQIDRDAVVAKLGDVHRQESQVITVLVPAHESEIADLIEINAMLHKNNICAVLVALVDASISMSLITEKLTSTTQEIVQVIDLTTSLASCGYLYDAVGRTLNLPEPMRGKVVSVLDEKVGTSLGAVVSEFLLWSDNLVKHDIIRYVPASGMVHIAQSALLSAPVSLLVASSISRRITEGGLSNASDIERLCSAVSATCSDTCSYELPVELALVVADVSRTTLDQAVSLGLCVVTHSDDFRTEILSLTHEHFRTLDQAQMDMHVRYIQVLSSQIDVALQSSSHDSFLTRPFRPGLVNFAVSLVPVLCAMSDDSKLQLKRMIFALSEHMFALSSVGSTTEGGHKQASGQTAATDADTLSVSMRLPSHSNLARLLLIGVQLSNGSLEYNKARIFSSAGVSLLSSLDKSVTKDFTVSMLHFQMHCETLCSFINQNVTQGSESEMLLLKQYSEGGSSRWSSGPIFSAILDLCQSVNFMQRCHYHDAFNFGLKVFNKDTQSHLAVEHLVSILSKCMSHEFWTEEISSVSPSFTQTDDVFVNDAFERLVLPSLSCGVEAVMKLLSIHTSAFLNNSGKSRPLSLTIIPMMRMLVATESAQIAKCLPSSKLLDFVAGQMNKMVPGLQFLQASLWTAFAIVPFSSPKSIQALVDAYSSKMHPVEVLSEMTTKPFEYPYNGSSLLGASHMLNCIANDLNDANEGDLCVTAQFFSTAVVFMSGCDVFHLSDALALKCESQSLSTFGERLLGSLMSVIRSPTEGRANCRKDAELLPDMFYFVILSIESLWNVVLGDLDATLSTAKRASVLKKGPMLPLFQMNLSFCSCLSKLQKLLVSQDDSKMSFLAEALDDFESLFVCLAPGKFNQQLQMIHIIKDPAVRTNRLISCLLEDSSAYLDHPGSGMLQIICALFCEFLRNNPKDISDCFENAYSLCVRDGLYVHAALSCHLGYMFYTRTCANRPAATSSDTHRSDEFSETSSSAFQEDVPYVMLEMRALAQLERSHALFSMMHFDTPVLMAQQAQPSLAAASYPDCPLSKSATHLGHFWFSGFIMHDRFLRMEGCFGAQSQSSLFGSNAANNGRASKFSGLIELSNRLCSDLHRIEAPGSTNSPVAALLHAAQIVGRMIGAQRASVVSKSSTSVSLSSTIQALAEISFVPINGANGENVVALCSESPVNNLPDWLLKYGFANRGVHIFQNVSTSFGSNLLSDREEGEVSLPAKKSSKFSFVSKSFSPRIRAMSRNGLSHIAGRRPSSSVLHAKQDDASQSSVVMLSWGSGSSGDNEQHVSYLLWFEHRQILGIFGPDFYLDTLRCSPEKFHPTAHPLAFLLCKCLSPLKSLFGTGSHKERQRIDPFPFTQKDIDEDTHGTQIADRLPIVGLLWKRGSMFKNWKERHFQLFNLTLKYFTKDDRVHALKSIEISHDMTLLEVSAEDRKEISAPFENCFCLMNETRQLYLCADQSARMKKWMKVLSSTIEHARKVAFRNTESYAFNACVAPPPLNSMIIVKRLGAGGFGEVFLASWNGLLVAVKKMTKELNATTLFRFRREADIMSVMRHPNILTYMACSLDPPNLMIVMEYMRYGSLFNVLQVRSYFDAFLRFSCGCISAIVFFLLLWTRA
jgi:hypothetical protein